MEPISLKRSFFQRLFGICATNPPKDEGCWHFSDGKLEIDLSRAPELSEPGGAIRLENKNLPERILIVRADEDRFLAYRNRCEHMGRRLDPVPGTGTVQCCSISKSTYDDQGKVVSGPAGKSVQMYRITAINNKLVLEMRQL